MRNKAVSLRALLAGWLAGSCIVTAVSAQETPSISEPSVENEPTVAETADEPAATAESDSPGSILDYEPTEAISEDLSVSFPVDI